MPLDTLDCINCDGCREVRRAESNHQISVAPCLVVFAFCYQTRFLDAGPEIDSYSILH